MLLHGLIQPFSYGIYERSALSSEVQKCKLFSEWLTVLFHLLPRIYICQLSSVISFRLIETLFVPSSSPVTMQALSISSLH